VDAASFLSAFLLVSALTIGRHQSVTAPQGLLRDVRQGIHEVARRRWIWTVIAAFTILNALSGGALNTLAPDLVDHGIGRFAWGLVLGCMALGLIGGSLLQMKWEPRRPLMVGMIAIALETPLFLALGHRWDVWAVAPLALLAGLGSACFGVLWRTALHTCVRQAVLGRVMSIDILGSMLAVPVGQLTAGLVAGRLGTERTMTVAAGCFLVVSLLVATLPAVRASRDQLRQSPAP
jgi:hypothetical protein